MRIEGFCASTGEEFCFTGEDGTEWKGTCKELRAIDDGLMQFRGVLRMGQQDLVDTEICGHYDPAKESFTLIAP